MRTRRKVTAGEELAHSYRGAAAGGSLGVLPAEEALRDYGFLPPSLVAAAAAHAAEVDAMELMADMVAGGALGLTSMARGEVAETLAEAMARTADELGALRRSEVHSSKNQNVDGATDAAVRHCVQL